jgi:hypothetical protein
MTSDTAIVAFVRTNSERPVLVIANVSDVAKSGVTVTSRVSGLAAGRYVGTNLLSSAAGPGISVARNGSVSAFVPVPTLAPFSAHVIELRRR